MRVYFPATLAMLMDLNTTGEFTSIGGTAFAVTPALRESYVSGDDDELADSAMREAARASLRLLAAEADAPGVAVSGTDVAEADDVPESDVPESDVPENDVPESDAADTRSGDTDRDASAGGLPIRRVVVAADLDPVTLRPDLDAAVVKAGPVVALSAIASVHVDVAEAEAAVIAALPVIDAADLGDEDAELAVGDVDDHDLAWYATQEVRFLLDLL